MKYTADNCPRCAGHPDIETKFNTPASKVCPVCGTVAKVHAPGCPGWHDYRDCTCAVSNSKPSYADKPQNAEQAAMSERAQLKAKLQTLTDAARMLLAHHRISDLRRLHSDTLDPRFAALDAALSMPSKPEQTTRTIPAQEYTALLAVVEAARQVCDETHNIEVIEKALANLDAVKAGGAK